MAGHSSIESTEFLAVALSAEMHKAHKNQKSQCKPGHSQIADTFLLNGTMDLVHVEGFSISKYLGCRVVPVYRDHAVASPKPLMYDC